METGRGHGNGDAAERVTMTDIFQCAEIGQVLIVMPIAFVIGVGVLFWRR